MTRTATSNVVTAPTVADATTGYVDMLRAAITAENAGRDRDTRHAQTCVSVSRILSAKAATAKALAEGFRTSGESLDSQDGATDYKISDETTMGYAYTVGLALTRPTTDDVLSLSPVTSYRFLQDVRKAVVAYGAKGSDVVRKAVAKAQTPAHAHALVLEITKAATKAKAEAKAADDKAKADKITDEADEAAEAATPEAVKVTATLSDVLRMAVAMIERGDEITDADADLIAALVGLIPATV